MKDEIPIAIGRKMKKLRTEEQRNEEERLSEFNFNVAKLVF